MSGHVIRFAGWVYLALATAAPAFLLRPPGIEQVAVAKDNPDKIWIRIDADSIPSAVSSDGGKTFQPADDREVPPGMTTELAQGTRRYTRAGQKDLFRSDDAGMTWKETGARQFLVMRARAEGERVEAEFLAEYGGRIPDRSPWWHPVFAIFAAGSVLLTLAVGRKRVGLPSACLTSLRGLLVIQLVWALLHAYHQNIFHYTHTQYPFAHWVPGAEFLPDRMTGFAMAIAAQPLPLLGYLLVLWPLLPGSAAIMFGERPSAAGRKRLKIALAVGCAVMICFHFSLAAHCMMRL